MNEIRKVSDFGFPDTNFETVSRNSLKTKAVRIHNYDPSKFDRSQVSFGARDADLESIYSDVDDRKKDENQNKTAFYNHGHLNMSNPRFPSRPNSSVYSPKERFYGLTFS